LHIHNSSGSRSRPGPKKFIPSTFSPPLLPFLVEEKSARAPGTSEIELQRGRPASQAMDASVLNNPRLKALMEVSHSNLDLKRTSDVISDSPLSGSDLVDAI